MKTAIVTGASGLVGTALMEQLIAHPDFGKIYNIARRPSGIVSEKVTEIVIDFDDLPGNLSGITADCAFCCLGTTLKTAGSKERQYVIDHDYVVRFAQACKEMHADVFAVVSSIGAAAASRNFYLRTKGEMERDCALLNFPKTVIVRPSFLLGKRKEFRQHTVDQSVVIFAGRTAEKIPRYPRGAHCRTHDPGSFVNSKTGFAHFRITRDLIADFDLRTTDPGICRHRKFCMFLYLVPQKYFMNQKQFRPL